MNNSKNVVDVDYIKDLVLREGLSREVADILSNCMSKDLFERRPPFGYFSFLCGLVRHEKLYRILEIGTGMCCSILSMYRGIRENERPRSEVVTVDIVTKNSRLFKPFPDVKRIEGDALASNIIKEVKRSFARDVDIIFIDAEHTYGYVKRCISVYANTLRPKYLVLDDIHFNSGMERLWREIETEFNGRTQELTKALGRGSCGIGLIEWDRKHRPNWEHSGFFQWQSERLLVALKNLIKKSSSIQ